MSEIVNVALLVAITAFVVMRLRRRRQRTVRAAQRESTGPSGAPTESPSGDASAVPNATGAQVAGLYEIAASMQEFYSASSHPKDLLAHPPFLRGVELLRRPETLTGDLLGYYTGANAVVSCMALEALARRSDDAGDLAEPLVAGINEPSFWTRWFALRAIDARVREPVVGALLARIDDRWGEPMLLTALREFIAQRTAGGESPAFGAHLARLVPNQAEWLSGLLDRLGAVAPQPLRDELRQWRNSYVNLDFLRSVGRVWRAADASAWHLVAQEPFVGYAADVESSIRHVPPKSALLVGEPGVGKTSTIRLLCQRLLADGWTVFEAGAAEVLAGQAYIGQLEERVQMLARELAGKPVLWVISSLHELLWAGRHRFSATSVLDLLLPYIESGTLKVVAETSARAYEQIVQQQPKLRGALDSYRLAPLSDAETLELARAWAAQRGGDGGTPRIAETTLREAFQLAKQFLGDRAAPGNLLHFLNAAHHRLLQAGAPSSAAITTADLLATLSELTGLPNNILDEGRTLDLAALRAFFERRVLGQTEAVECLTERVAMIKAGLTDPTRPAGVFLFVGPTGTGKTEIAKALAEYLFGSPERMIRLDMSEFQSPDSLDRILGERDELAGGTALVNAIRKQPFSVVLLDEFEKAHSNVWDLFLQLFDDGRLTDRRGNTADFRHCIVIMTSNLGATVARGASIGFTGDSAHFAPGTVERAVAETFRREFVNRIDRIVVFHPLARGVMRDLLRKELTDVLGRRGLRNRAWAVEWDESAIEFLLQKGFSPDLGARPLKRAVERYLLAPLAMTIVRHEVPQGDQFLFVRSDGARIDVEFVDPDAPDDEAPAVPPAAPEAPEARSLETVALDPRGTSDEVRFLSEEYQALAERVRGDEWQREKQRALARMSSPGFWNAAERFKVLGAAEYMDRIEVGLETAGSLLRRLTGSHPRERLPRDLVGRLAQQLYLVDAACEGLTEGLPRDAFLLVRASRDPGAERAVSDAFATRLGRMYRRWAEKRRMHLTVLEEAGAAGGDGEGYRLLLAVSGFGAYPILEAESGVHVLETPQDEKSFNRARAHVRVVAQPDAPARDGQSALHAQAIAALSSAKETGLVIVRRYREEPSPLVRDSVRQWRTGRLDLVFGGDFDLIG